METRKVNKTTLFRIIQAALQKLNLTNVFAEIYSAEAENLGKPHPVVYLITARKLNVAT